MGGGGGGGGGGGSGGGVGVGGGGSGGGGGCPIADAAGMTAPVTSNLRLASHQVTEPGMVGRGEVRERGRGGGGGGAYRGKWPAEC